jgi:hypothetical protein
MADKYTIQIQPQIGASDAQKMESDLNRRFANVAKKFGTHLKNTVKTSLKTAAIATGAAGAGLVASAVFGNPIEKINEDLNKTVMTADELATRADQLGINLAKFAEFGTIAQSMQIDPVLALQQFQTALQDSADFLAGDETKKDYLINFLKDGDLLDSFYAYMREMRKLGGKERGREMSKIFGDRLQSRIAELAQVDLGQRRKEIYSKGITPEIYGSAVSQLAEKEDLQSKLKAKRDIDELIQKNRAITTGTIKAQDQYLRSKLGRETQQLSQYEIFAKQAVLQEKMLGRLDEIKAELVQTLFPIIEKMVDLIDRIWTWVQSKMEEIKKKGIVRAIF